MENRFIFEKTVLMLLLPPSGLLLMAGAGLLLLRRGRQRLGTILVLGSLALLYLLSTPLCSNPLMMSLERNYPPGQAIPASPDAIVVLTGGLKEPAFPSAEPVPNATSTARLVQGVTIYRSIQKIPFVICGGSGDPARPDLSEAKALARTALALGVRPEDLIIEDGSRNTIEGARRVTSLLGGAGKRIVLVTSAYHMGRSLRFFRNAGLDIIPAPTDYRGERIRLHLNTFIPGADHLYNSSRAIYEYLSSLRYALLR